MYTNTDIIVSFFLGTVSEIISNMFYYYEDLTNQIPFHFTFTETLLVLQKVIIVQGQEKAFGYKYHIGSFISNMKN